MPSNTVQLTFNKWVEEQFTSLQRNVTQQAEDIVAQGGRLDALETWKTDVVQPAIDTVAELQTRVDSLDAYQLETSTAGPSPATVWGIGLGGAALTFAVVLSVLMVILLRQKKAMQEEITTLKSDLQQRSISSNSLSGKIDTLDNRVTTLERRISPTPPPPPPPPYTPPTSPPYTPAPASPYAQWDQMTDQQYYVDLIGTQPRVLLTRVTAIGAAAQFAGIRLQACTDLHAQFVGIPNGDRLDVFPNKHVTAMPDFFEGQGGRMIRPAQITQDYALQQKGVLGG